MSVRRNQPSKKRAAKQPIKDWTDRVKEQAAIDRACFYAEGMDRLERNNSDAEAGELLCRLIDISPNSKLIRFATQWLSLHSNDKWTFLLLARMLKLSPAPEIVRMAEARIKSLDDCEWMGCVIREILESKHSPVQFELLEKAMEHNHKSQAWKSAFTFLSTDTSPSTLNLLVHWLELNVDEEMNVHLLMLPATDEVRSAFFKWMQQGGQSGDYMPESISYLIEQVYKSQQPLLAEVLDFSRKWLSANLKHEETGRVYAAMIRATHSEQDLSGAKHWYLDHQDDENAWLVISNMLGVAFCECHEIGEFGEFAIEQAQTMLRTQEYRRAALIGNLVSVWADDESIAWAKDLFRRQKILWVLKRLIGKSPDAESILLAEEAFESWKDTNDEAEMLYLILKVDSSNKLARRRARVWLRRSPENKYCLAFKAVFESE